MPTDSPRERREHDRKAPSAPRPGLLFIVSRDALDYYEHLRRAFAGNHRVAVILDRPTAAQEDRRPRISREGPPGMFRIIHGVTRHDEEKTRTWGGGCPPTRVTTLPRRGR